MDQAKDIPSTATTESSKSSEAPQSSELLQSLEASKSVETPKPVEAPPVATITLDEPSITAIKTPAMALSDFAAVKPEFKPTAEPVRADPGPRRSAGMMAGEVASNLRAFIRPPRVGRYAQLAAATVLASSFGAFAGVFGASQFLSPQPAPVVAAAPDAKDIAASLRAEIAALKAGIDSTTRNANAQFAKLSDRFERAEKAQAEPAAKLARIGETLERLEKRPQAALPAPPTVAAPVTTAAVTPVPAADTTGSIPDKPAVPPKPAIVEGWVLRDFYDGIALLEGRRGMIEVSAGQNVPGVGQVQAIKKVDGRWVVVTAKGVIVSAR